MGLPKNCKIKISSKFKRGAKNLITDVLGVQVGHITLVNDNRDIHTGVTAILPHGENLFENKVLAASYIINGFGKSVGLVQIDELGTIETPIIMTNTFGIGTALNTLTKYALRRNRAIGDSTCTVNCVVTECNDGELNDIRGMHITEANVLRAIDNCDIFFEEGDVGAGTGMVCMGIKGGIGSSSRIVSCDGKEYVIGAILMSNFGMPGNLIIDGQKKYMMDVSEEEIEKGSIIIVIGTDLPLSERQLKRVAKRSTVALSKVGSFLGNGSGDIAIAFSNANMISHFKKKDIIETKMLYENTLDKVFEATVEAVEEAIISSLYHAKSTKGIRGKTVRALKDFL